MIALPYWHGFRSAPPGWHFAGFVGTYHNDYNSYLAWIRQASDGHMLFKDCFTTEPHGRVFFHPLFWLMGTATRVLSAPLIAVWYAVELLACALLIGVVYRLGAHFSNDRTVRFLFLALVTTAAGFGWLTEPLPDAPWEQRSIDLWMAEANAFQAMATSFFTLPLALAFMLASFLHALRYIELARMRDAVCSGLYGLALAATHQYDMVTLYAVLGAWFLVAGRRRLRGAGVLAAIPIPFCLYSLAVVKLDPVFSIHTQAEMKMPTIEAHLLGWGLVIPLALLGLVQPAMWRGKRSPLFMAVWLVVNLILLAFPLGFQRKLIWGMHVPLCFLAAMGSVNTLRWLAGGLGFRAAVGAIVAGGCVILAGVSAIGNLHLYAGFFERNRRHALNDYLPQGYLDTFDWLEQNSESGDVVLASPGIAPLIPGRSGNVVFAGHWAQTLDLRRKYEFISALFTPGHPTLPDAGANVLKDSRVRYVVLDKPTRQNLGLPPGFTDFGFAAQARVAFRNEWVTIWELAAQ